MLVQLETIIELKNSSDCQIRLSILTLSEFLSFLKLFPNLTACSPISSKHGQETKSMNDCLNFFNIL